LALLLLLHLMTPLTLTPHPCSLAPPSPQVQRYSCAALHALACRSTPLAQEVVRHDGVRLITKAMSTYRSDAAARLQASACGALAALVDRVGSVLGDLLDFSVPPLIEQTLEDFAICTEVGAVVFVCGGRALLTMGDTARPGSVRLSDTRLEEFAFKAADAGAKAADARADQASFVDIVCCEIFAALARERLHMLAAGELDFHHLLRAGGVARAARFVADTLQKQPDHYAVASVALSAATPLVQLHFVAHNAYAQPGDSSRRSGTTSTNAEGAISRNDLLTIGKLARQIFQRTLTIPDDLFILAVHGLAGKALTEVERCRSGISSLSLT